jgi:hypothetical protein
MSPERLGLEIGFAGEAQQQLKTTDPTSRERGRPIITNPQPSKDNFKGEENNYLSGKTGRLEVKQELHLIQHY